MLYEELNPNIDYSRKNLRIDGWGAHTEDFFLKDHIPEILANLSVRWAMPPFPKTPAKPWEELTLRKTRLTLTEQNGIEKIIGKENFKTDNYERIFHSAGRSYYDVLRIRLGLLKEYVDGVAYPSNEQEVQNLFQYCSSKNIALIPFGGGSSVVGGVEAVKSDTQKAILSLDMTRMTGFVELDTQSRTATFEAGIYGPKLEKSLNDKSYTLGHFPQSFEYSTLGGWIAARSSGQQSGKYGRIDKILNSLRMVTSNGIIQTLKLPPASTGPDLNQIIAGSEGLLGIITQVTVKIHPLPQSRKYFGILFPDFEKGTEFIREANLKGLKLSMSRLSDEDETELFGTLASLGKKQTFTRKLKTKLINNVLRWNGIGNVKTAMIAGIDSSLHEIEEILPRVKYLAEKHGGFYAGESPGKNWLKSRYNMPFLRNYFLESGVGVDTLETSITYDRIHKLHNAVKESIRAIMPKCYVMCHISHSYHDGASLYFTIIFPLDLHDPIAQWWNMKKAASDTIFEIGGSISHHHGVGTDHKEWYEKALGQTAKDGLLALKNNWDPKGILNPGKLFY
jgi:alkyldihydroxyacetonephosphate synthase